jgi:cell division transport system permease protein
VNRRRNQRRRRAPRWRQRLDPAGWLLHHLQSAVSSLGRLARNPLGTALTAAVIGIALALPGGLYLLVDNVRALGGTWTGTATLSLFLDRDIADDEAELVRAQIAQRPDIGQARLISRAEALEEFRRLSGFGDALELLDENPLPPVVLATPAEGHDGIARMTATAEALQAYREIDLAQVDLKWVQRLAAMTDVIERATVLLAALLSAAVLLIVGNTIRLEIQNRQAEIEVVKLVGGTDGFIRRPFLYEGLWHGLLGALVALLLVILSMHLLEGPVTHLASLYESAFTLVLASPGTLLGIVVGGPMLGLAGAWLAVGRRLARIQPE